MTAHRYTLERLEWSDPPLGEIALPARPLVLRASFGSGLARREGDPPGHVWAVGDRGPNLKVKDAIGLYGLEALEPLRKVPGAKIMPRLDVGPAIAELRVADGRVELLRTLRVTAPDGKKVSGLPMPSAEQFVADPVFDLAGNPLPRDPGGLDTEGIVALSDGGFWIGDEFGPSLVRVGAEGRVVVRLVPEGLSLDAPYPVEPRLPALAARRQLNRGFEALALSADERWLFLAFQSPLAHPDEAAHEQARHVRLWRLDAASGAFAAEYLYPLDPPESFLRDHAEGEFGRGDVKVGEMLCLSRDRLLVLERGSKTTKLYFVDLDETRALPPEHLEPSRRPTVEELSGGADPFPLPSLEKSLLFTSDEAPELARDCEGMAVLSPRELLIVNDNDFGVEGAETSFWKLSFEQPVFA